MAAEGSKFMGRRLWMALGVVALVAVAGFFAWRALAPREGTDDAQVSGHVSPVADARRRHRARDQSRRQPGRQGRRRARRARSARLPDRRGQRRGRPRRGGGRRTRGAQRRADHVGSGHERSAGRGGRQPATPKPACAAADREVEAVAGQGRIGESAAGGDARPRRHAPARISSACAARREGRDSQAAARRAPRPTSRPLTPPWRPPRRPSARRRRISTWPSRVARRPRRSLQAQVAGDGGRDGAAADRAQRSARRPAPTPSDAGEARRSIRPDSISSAPTVAPPPTGIVGRRSRRSRPGRSAGPAAAWRSPRSTTCG